MATQLNIYHLPNVNMFKISVKPQGKKGVWIEISDSETNDKIINEIVAIAPLGKKGKVNACENLDLHRSFN